jgi:hypothetical protein
MGPLKIKRLYNGALLAERLAYWSIPEPNSGCWLWLGSTTKKGYGLLTVAGKQRLATHCVMEIATGIPIRGSHVLHTCDNQYCVNPDHLYIGSSQDNHRDMAIRNRGSQGGGIPFGVRRNGRGWNAAIKFRGRMVRSATYRSIEVAAEAAKEMKSHIYFNTPLSLWVWPTPRKEW